MLRLKKIKQIPCRQVITVLLRLIPTAIFMIFLYVMMIFSFTGVVKETVKETELSFSGLETLSDSFEDVLEKNLYGRTEYINLNGLTTRVLGIHALNRQCRMENGQLCYIGNVAYREDYTENVIELNHFLQDRGVEFLCVLAPDKRAFYDAELPPGYTSTARINYNEMCEVLSEAGVPLINMDSWYEENGWTMDDVYYKTDHHWNTQGCLAAVRLTMEYLSEYGLAEYDPTLLDAEHWTISTYENWFLGSHGKRTGTAYTGTDDITLYQPNFATDYSYSYLKSGTTVWTDTDTILNLDYLDSRDYFNENPYNMYMIGDYPNRMTVNTKAANKSRILLLGDSFKIPLEYFLTTQFQEVYTVDLRYTTDGATFVQYVQEFQPDIVIMCSNTIDANDLLYTFGVSEYLLALEATDANAESIDLGDFLVNADEDRDDAFAIVCSDLKPGQTYTLTVNSADCHGENGRHIQMTLQDISSNAPVINRYFDCSSNTQTWIFTVPEKADTYAIYLYAGTKGAAADGPVEVTGAVLREGIFESESDRK